MLLSNFWSNSFSCLLRRVEHVFFRIFSSDRLSESWKKFRLVLLISWLASLLPCSDFSLGEILFSVFISILGSLMICLKSCLFSSKWGFMFNVSLINNIRFCNILSPLNLNLLESFAIKEGPSFSSIKAWLALRILII